MQSESIDKLKKWFPMGSTVYTVLRHVSKSYMQRSIGIVMLNGNDDHTVDVRHPNHSVAEVLGYRRSSKGDGIIVRGIGQDMGFAIVDELSRKLYGRSGALRHEWI